MHFTIPLLCLLSTRASALPNPLESKRQQFSYNGPLGPAHACPGINPSSVLGLETAIYGAPPNYPNYECLPMSTAVDWIGINLFLSNSSALQAYSDPQCANRIAFIEWPQSLGEGNYGFCAKQSENGGVGSWKGVRYEGIE